ncbi:MAG: acyl-CoA dehydrogenase family protein [Acidimicrobiales bacterium]
MDGSMEFCGEFFDDVAIPASAVVGDVDDGWNVATRLLTHERMAVGGGSPYTSGRSIGHDSARADTTVVDAARATGRTHDGHVRQLVAEAHVRQLVGAHLVQRITQGMSTGAMPPPAGSLMKLFSATNVMRRTEIALSWWARAAAWPEAPSRRRPGGRRHAVAPGRVARRRLQRDPAQHHQRAAARHAPRVRRRPEIPYREVRRGAGTKR